MFEIGLSLLVGWAFMFLMYDKMGLAVLTWRPYMTSVNFRPLGGCPGELIQETRHHFFGIALYGVRRVVPT